MSRIFIYEHLCATASSSPLRAEGWAMLSALAEDFRALPDCEVWTLLDAECPAERFDSLAAQADATVVIAPETGGVLAHLARQVEAVNGRSLGCTPAAIELTADKKALSTHWQKHGVPTPELLEPAHFPGFAVVLKPRDGAGSQATFRIRDSNEWDHARQEASRELPGEFLLQRLAPGQPASVAFLLGPGATVPLAPAAQHLSDDGRFHYLGGEVPLPSELAQRALDLAARAIACVPGLAGYVGVDLVLGADASQDVAIEINPRLTTSYLGLRRLAHSNLAEVWWDIAQSRRPPAVSWRENLIRFQANGQVNVFHRGTYFTSACPGVP